MHPSARTALTPSLIAMLVLTPLFWAGNAIVGRMMVGQVPPLLLNTIRWSLALLILLFLGRRVWRQLSDVRHRWPYLALLGLLGIGCYNSLQYAAMHTSTPMNVTLIASSTPVWMLLLGRLFYNVLPLGRQWVGAGLSLLGVICVLTKGRFASLQSIEWVAGDWLMLIAVILWAVYSWQLARPPLHMQGDARPAWGWGEWLST